MRVQHREEQPTGQAGGELRFDTESLRKVTSLAQKLQVRHEETFTAGEVETIGAEVGVDPRFIREAVRQFESSQETKPRKVVPTARSRALNEAFIATWWSTGWVIPFILGPLFARLFDHLSAFVGFFLGWPLYIGVGIYLSVLHNAQKQAAHPPGANEATPDLSRQAILEALFTLQKELEKHKGHRAFLSIDVVNSTGMKLGEADLAVEHSFGQFHHWVEELVTALGGQVHSAAGDGIMCAFSDDGTAVRAARRIQEGIASFNAERNRLTIPFQVRCGLSAGNVPLETGGALGRLNSAVVDRAAQLQKRAVPGDIVISGELAQAALLELGPVAPLPNAEPGEAVFSWHAARR